MQKHTCIPERAYQGPYLWAQLSVSEPISQMADWRPPPQTTQLGVYALSEKSWIDHWWLYIFIFFYAPLACVNIQTDRQTDIYGNTSRMIKMELSFFLVKEQQEISLCKKNVHY